MRKTSEKNRRQLKVRLVAAAVTFGLFAAQADVWEDCAWRLGEVKDANENGVLDNGDVTEYFHAADPADGAHQIKTSPVSTEEAFTNGEHGGDARDRGRPREPERAPLSPPGGR